MESGLFLTTIFEEPLRLLFFLIGIILGLTVHEFAHAFVALRQGDPTARDEGRVSLNPMAHLDPLGSLLFLLVGLGWAKPVPVNPFRLKDGRLGDFYVSIAGIVTNLIIAFIFFIPFQIIIMAGGDISIGSILAGDNIWLLFCLTVASANLLLAAFNLIPIPPLDGSKAIGILVPRSLQPAYEEYLRVGPALLIALFGASFIFGTNYFGYIIDPIMSLFAFLAFIPTSLQGSAPL